MGPGSGPIGGRIGPKRAQKDSGNHVKSKKINGLIAFEHFLMAETAFEMPQKTRKPLVSLPFERLGGRASENVGKVWKSAEIMEKRRKA